MFSRRTGDSASVSLGNVLPNAMSRREVLSGLVPSVWLTVTHYSCQSFITTVISVLGITTTMLKGLPRRHTVGGAVARSPHVSTGQPEGYRDD